MRIVLALVGMVWLASCAAADTQEAILPDGRRLTGELLWNGQGRLRFFPSGKAPALLLEQVLQIRWPDSAPPVEGAYRVRLRGGQELSGTLVGLDAQTVRFRTLWGEALSVRRSAAAGVLHSPPRTDLLHPAGDPDQDEVWLASGDQLFGSVPGADPRKIDWRGRSGERTLPWDQVRGLSFRREAPAGTATDGEHVRVWLHAAARAEPDILEGTVQAFDRHGLVLRHATLGPLNIPADYLQRLDGLFYGRRLILDENAHHLGARARPTFALPRADGLGLRRAFNLEAVTLQAQLLVVVTHLKGNGDGIGPALERGGLRTEVVLNGRVVDYLNRHVDRAAPRPRRLRVDLPAGTLRAGENVVELRQTADAETGRYEDCIVSGLAVEVPR
jgi:hypothetical protein